MTKIESNDGGLAELEAIRRRLAELESSQSLGLVWRDIPEEVESKLRDEVPVLIPEPDLNVEGKVPSDQSHVLIEGDNLHALHVLQATHRGAIDVIYIDPPYNTGKEFVYNDKLVDHENSWRHSAWLSFMEKRLRLAQSLLKPTGLIFISIDDNEQHRLHMLCDQIFGEANFVATFSWQNADTLKNDAKLVSPNSEAILLFAKEKKLLNRFRGVPKGEKQRKVYKNPDSDPRGPYLLTPLHAKSGSATNNYKYRFSNGQTWTPPPGTFPRFSKETLARMDAEGAIWLDPKRKKVPQRKTYLADVSDRMPLWTFLRYEDFGSTRQSNAEVSAILGKGMFQNPKPTRLILRLLDAVSEPRSVVLDFFAGSGTTLHAVALLNAEDDGTRQCILVTNNENEICREVTAPRIKAILTGKWADKEKHDVLPGSMTFYKTGFVKRSKSPDRMRTEIAKHTVDLIAIKEGAGKTVSRTSELVVLYGLNKTIAVAPGLEPDHEKLFANAERKARTGDRKIVYLFTWSDQGVEAEFAAMWPGWEVEPLPAEMLSAMRRNAPQPKLFDTGDKK